MSRFVEFEGLLKGHLDLNQTDFGFWRIDKSVLHERGLFANCDINSGDIIFVDRPLVVGPRAGVATNFYCVVCLSSVDTKGCSKGCALPVCSELCEKSEKHVEECDLIRRKCYQNKMQEDKNFICQDLFRTLTPLRALLLDDRNRNLLKNLACHFGPSHDFEVNLIKKHLQISEAEEYFLRTVCGVLDANAFETRAQSKDNVISLRGLYPLSSLLNHSCVPNTTHVFNEHQQMVVKATGFIPKDTEITTTYTSLLWATASRRLHLSRTKHFECNCKRCLDPKEFNTCLNGLKCLQENCDGILYALNPLKNTSKWKCTNCSLVVPSKQIGIVQTALGTFLKRIDASNIEQLINLIKTRLENVVPKTNQITIELKYNVMWTLGYSKNYLWNDLTDDQLNLKKQICKELLQLLQTLQMGQCRMRGQLLYELYRCRLQKYSNNLKSLNNNELLLREAAQILAEDATAPEEIKSYLNTM